MATEKKKRSKKKLLFDILFWGILAAVIFVPGTRALLQQGLIKVGLFKPSVEAPNKNTLKNERQAHYEMSFISDGGFSLDLNELKGKVVFINFWATWCPPCIAEMPTIETLYKKLEGNKNVVFVILEVEANRAKAPAFMKKRNLDLPVYYPTSNIPKAFYDGVLPTTVILDKKGNIAHRSPGLTNFSGQKIADYLKDLSSL